VQDGPRHEDGVTMLGALDYSSDYVVLRRFFERERSFLAKI